MSEAMWTVIEVASVVIAISVSCVRFYRRRRKNSRCEYWNRQEAREAKIVERYPDDAHKRLLAVIFAKPTEAEEKEDELDPMCERCGCCVLYRTEIEHSEQG